MATTPTTHYSLGKPANAGDSGAWGTELNTALDAIDTQMYVTAGVAAAAVPSSGNGTTPMTGTLNVLNSTDKFNAIATTSGAASCNLALGNIATVTVAGVMTLTISGAPATAGAAVELLLKVTNGGSAALTISPTPKTHAGAGLPTLTTSGVDFLSFISFDNGTSWSLTGAQLDVR